MHPRRAPRERARRGPLDHASFQPLEVEDAASLTLKIVSTASVQVDTEIEAWDDAHGERVWHDAFTVESGDFGTILGFSFDRRGAERRRCGDRACLASRARSPQRKARRHRLTLRCERARSSPPLVSGGYWAWQTRP